MSTSLEFLRKQAEQARDAAVAADHARRPGTDNPVEALRLEHDFIIAAAACAFHERVYRDALAKAGV